MFLCSKWSVFLLCLLWFSGSKADWTGLSGFSVVSEIRVEPHHLRQSIRIHQDMLSRPVPPDESTHDTVEWNARHTLEIRTESGVLLRGDIQSSQNVVTASPPYQQVDLLYSLPEHTQQLQLVPERSVSLGVVTLHRGVVVNDLAPLKTAARLTLDEGNPWLSHFDQPELSRNHSEPRSYLYVASREIRHELLLRYADLVAALGSQPAHPDDLAALGQLLASRNTLSIDGIARSPHLDRVEWVAYGAGGPTPLVQAQDQDAASRVLGAVLVYALEKPAERLELTWDMFGISPRRNVSVLSGQEALDTYVTRAHPRLEWSIDDRPGSLEPDMASQYTPDNSVDAQHRLPDSEGIKKLVQTVLYNTYLAFQMPDEEPAYDRLALGLSGDLLAETYRQQRLTWLQRGQGMGGGGEVNQVEIVDSQIKRFDPNTLVHEVEARWITRGRVAHYGHVHARNRQYHAYLSLQPASDGRWKITALSTREEPANG